MEDQNYNCKLPGCILVDGHFLTWALGSTYHASTYTSLKITNHLLYASLLGRAVCQSGQGAQTTPDTRAVQSYQQVFEPFCPHPPVQTQVLGEKAGDILPPSVRHEACRSQLSHVGINKRNPCFAICRDKRQRWHMMTFWGTHKPTCVHAFTATQAGKTVPEYSSRERFQWGVAGVQPLRSTGNQMGNDTEN